jgi:hypothetical protein
MRSKQQKGRWSLKIHFSNLSQAAEQLMVSNLGFQGRSEFEGVKSVSMIVNPVNWML